MNSYEPEMTSPGTEYLSGDYLFVAGSDLYNRLNQPSQHMPYHLARHLERLDLVGYARFYDGPPAPAWQRLKQGMRNVLSHRISIYEEGRIRTIKARRLLLPGSLDPLVQDLWLYMILRPHLKRGYHVGIVDGPESALLALLLKKTGRVGFLIYYDIDYYPGVSPQWSGLLSRREQICCKVADAVASVSRPLAALREQQGAKLAAVVPNGVDFASFHAANLIRKEHPPTLIYTGSLDARWGVDLSIRAMPLLRRQIPGIRLLIAGRGRAEQELHQLALSLGVNDCVCFEGFVPYPDLPNLLAQADIGVATSRQNIFRQYASPLKIVEYMAAGLPVICSGGGEAEQMIEESRAGTNIPFELEAFAEAVQSLWATAGRMSAAREAAINYARSRSWEQMGTLMAQLVSRVAGMANGSQAVAPTIES
ncbi:MAG: glycosyltransferase family 4 protein [Anaerolineales bacterium]|jgi:glycosyltransferase involved in cell wall biosynthesis